MCLGQTGGGEDAPKLEKEESWRKRKAGREHGASLDIIIAAAHMPL